jgi:fructokinase
MNQSPCLFGEVLFDVFPDGREILGGAPFNVAWHLRGFGLEPLLISRVGEDAPGRRIRAAMAAWGMRLDGLQTDPERPTGRVAVSLKAGEPIFDIVANSAWDFIAADELPDLNPSLIYHGSLALRHPVSATALDRLLAGTGASGFRYRHGDRSLGQGGGATPRPLRFIDVNLRPPWWQPGVVRCLLDDADWAKLNQDELACLSPTSSPDAGSGHDGAFIPVSTAAMGPCPPPLAGEEPGLVATPADALAATPLAALAATAATFRAGHDLQGLVLTLGAAGALAVDAMGQTARVDAEPMAVMDAVGAGDAFAAVTILGLLHDWPLALTLERAQTFASRIVQIRGATAPDPTLYLDLRQAWQTP